MPVIESTFRPPLLLSNGHVQTCLGAIHSRRVTLMFERERLELADGDFVDLDWARDGNDRIAVISHGLEGETYNDCVRSMAMALNAAGWDALAWNFRSCGGAMNRLARFYHSGETEDLAAVIARAAAEHSRVALIGFSLGGNMTLKYLGEAMPHPAVVAGVGISVPIDLAGSSRKLDRQWGNGIYLRRFMKSLIAKVRAKAPQFPGELDATGVDGIRTFAAFDNRYTAPLHGFRDAAEYWERSSARQYLPGISVPTLLLNARNDPFLARECYPYDEARENPMLTLETPASGGHVGFLDFKNGLEPWSNRRAIEFLDAHAERTNPLTRS